MIGFVIGSADASTRAAIRRPPAASRKVPAGRSVPGGSHPATDARNEARNTLIDLFMECREHDADGYGSSPAARLSFALAYGLLGALPPDLPTPDVGMDPDGEASLEWHAGPGWTFGVSVGDDGVLACSGLLGPDTVTFRARLFPDEIPGDVLRYARQVARHID